MRAGDADKVSREYRCVSVPIFCTTAAGNDRGAPMSQQGSQEKSTTASRSGIDEQWLALHREDILEPELEIVDPHHHLWDFARHRYLLHDLLADTGSGHNVTQTVFIECTACYR